MNKLKLILPVAAFLIAIAGAFTSNATESAAVITVTHRLVTPGSCTNCFDIFPETNCTTVNTGIPCICNSINIQATLTPSEGCQLLWKQQ